MRDRKFTTIETERLVLRRFADADAPVFAAYRADPEVARYQSWDGFTVDDAERFIAGLASDDPGVPGEWFQFAVTDRDSNRLLGDCAIALDAGDPPSAEIGYTMSPGAQGRGYATEAVRGLLGYAFDHLDVRGVHAVTDVRNGPSIAVAERLGMRRIATISTTFKGEACDEHTFEMTREEWRNR
ncbi:MAG TPA: GNAT family N-acetyltransferase [Actinomycetota bacterium]